MLPLTDIAGQSLVVWLLEEHNVGGSRYYTFSGSLPPTFVVITNHASWWAQQLTVLAPVDQVRRALCTAEDAYASPKIVLAGGVPESLLKIAARTGFREQKLHVLQWLSRQLDVPVEQGASEADQVLALVQKVCPDMAPDALVRMLQSRQEASPADELLEDFLGSDLAREYVHEKDHAELDNDRETAAKARDRCRDYDRQVRAVAARLRTGTAKQAAAGLRNAAGKPFGAIPDGELTKAWPLFSKGNEKVFEHQENTKPDRDVP